MRKSLLSSLYGIHVHEGHIDLDATLEELGIGNKEPLTPTEKQATIRHLLQARCCAGSLRSTRFGVPGADTRCASSPSLSSPE